MSNVKRILIKLVSAVISTAQNLPNLTNSIKLPPLTLYKVYLYSSLVFIIGLISMSPISGGWYSGVVSPSSPPKIRRRKKLKLSKGFILGRGVTLK